MGLGNGFKTYYYDNGQKKEEGTLFHWKKNGLWTEWYENGQKKTEATYKDGKADGMVTYWHQNGQMKSRKTYKYGKLDGLDTYWYENGQKAWEETIEDGRRDGLKTKWYENGQKREEATYKYGKLDGLQTLWYEDGQKEYEGTFKDGKNIIKVNSLKNDIIELLKDRGTKMPASDIDAHLKHQNVDEIKDLSEEMYHDGKISRTGNYRYFILSEEKKKPKKTSAPKSEEVDVEKELEKLKGLLDKGLITQEMSVAKAKELLGL